MQLEMHLSRNTDPLSSHEAAASIVESGKHQRDCQIVLLFLSRRAGVTARELAYDMALALGGTEAEHNETTHKRLNDLRAKGLARVEMNDEEPRLRKCRRGHRLAQTWIAT